MPREASTGSGGTGGAEGDRASAVSDLGIAALALVAGVIAGLASVVLYSRDWGLTLVTIACVAALLLIPAGIPRAAAATGWIVMVMYASGGGPGGDVLVAQDVRAAFLVLDAFIFGGIAAATWPRKRHVSGLSSTP